MEVVGAGNLKRLIPYIRGSTMVLPVRILIIYIGKIGNIA
jgi:hypothetical protein